MMYDCDNDILTSCSTICSYPTLSSSLKYSLILTSPFYNDFMTVVCILIITMIKTLYQI